MPANKNTRDLEEDYLALSYQIEDLLHKKTSAYDAQEQIEQCHRRLVQLSRDILSAEDPQDLEYDYLATAYKMQDLLQKKAQAYSLSGEFQDLHEQLEAIAGELQWSSAGSAAGADSLRSSDINQLKNQVEELTDTLVEAN